MVCKDDLQQTCEKDFYVLCPPGFELCSPQKYNNNNRGWNGSSPIELLGKIYCRDSGGAGQVYLNGKYTMSLINSMKIKVKYGELAEGLSKAKSNDSNSPTFG